MKKRTFRQPEKPLLDAFGAWPSLLALVVIGCTAAESHEKKPRVHQPAPTEAAELNGIRVRVAPAVTARFEGRVSLTGIAKPRKTATVAAEIPGRIVKNQCTVGHRVRKNDPVYQVDTSNIRLDLKQARENLDARRTDAAFSERELVRSEALFKEDVQPEQATTKSRYDRDRARHGVNAAETAILRAQKALRDAVIRAPFSGTIAHCAAEKGDYMRPGTPVFKIADLEEIRLEVGVPAALAAGLSLNARAKAEFEALGGASRDATLVETSPSPNARSGAYPARFAVENKDGAVLEGMTAKITLGGAPRKVTAVPREAVFRVDGAPRIFVVREGRAVERAVRLGIAENGMVEIQSGVTPGERIVEEGMFALTDGQAVLVEQNGEEE